MPKPLTMALALIACGTASSAYAQSPTLIQEEEAPGSAIEMDIEPGKVVIGRQRNLNPSPVEIQGRTLDVPNDPDTPGFKPEPLEQPLIRKASLQR